VELKAEFNKRGYAVTAFERSDVDITDAAQVERCITECDPAIVLNSAGTVVLLVGSIASARRRRDPRPLLVAAGVAVIAAASTATRAGSYAAFALGQAAGITLILLGLVTRRLGPR